MGNHPGGFSLFPQKYTGFPEFPKKSKNEA